MKRIEEPKGIGNLRDAGGGASAGAGADGLHVDLNVTVVARAVKELSRPGLRHEQLIQSILRRRLIESNLSKLVQYPDPDVTSGRVVVEHAVALGLIGEGGRAGHHVVVARRRDGSGLPVPADIVDDGASGVAESCIG